VDGRRRLIAAFNRSDGPRRITIPWTQLGAGLRTEGQVQTLRYTPAFVSRGTAEDVAVASDSGFLVIDLPARTGTLLTPQ
ncbi:MAG: hypothetical protein AAF752_09770, partial [Bacteroidota bacterium]